ncbi:hypothetical protein C1645_837646 [Glomus cerebriforme]|uniref:Uncharacterized protein n=1 Tax=Glomus cerebriforme TaxID=658196 RepID=A0A397SF29_9GLOM|nr:hypothetical protein C1645_837646 [Glomus cerebriforme]
MATAQRKYPTASDYLICALEPPQKSWAKSYITTFFVAGVQSTQCVEGYNSVIKRVVNGRLQNLATRIFSLTKELL